MRNPIVVTALNFALALAGCAAPTGGAVPDGGMVMGRVVGPGSLARGGAIVAAGGGNIVAAGGGNLVAAGGGNYIGHNGAAFTRGLLAMSDAYLPVVGTRVQAVGLDGRVLAEALTDARGAYAFTGLPRNSALALRTVFATESTAKAYYLSALVATEGALEGQVLDPINTLIEAKFAGLLAARPERARSVGMAALKALWTDANALDATIPADRIEASRTVADMGALYLELAQRYPSLKPGIKRFFETLGEAAPF